MDVKQVLEDVKLRAKNDRRVWAVAGLAVVALILWSASTDRAKAKRPRVGIEVDSASNPSPSGNEGYEDLIKYISDDLKNTQAAVREQASQSDRIAKEQKASQEKLTGVISEIVNRIEMLDEGLKKVEQTKNETPEQGSNQAAPDQLASNNEPESLETFGGGEAPMPVPPTPPQMTRRTFISPGDAVQLRLLTGVAAPVDGTPYPVMFKLLGPVSGPDGSALDLGEGRIVAAAQGSETDGRVVYRLTDLAFRNNDGRRSVVKVDGWVVGEDGIRGMRGKVIDKLGQVILATMAYSGAAATGDAVLRRYQNNFNTFNSFLGVAPGDRRRSGAVDLSLNQNDLDLAAASALTDGGIRVTQLLLDKYEKMVPVVEVNSGRDVVAVFSRGAEVSVYDEEEEGGVHTAALD